MKECYLEPNQEGVQELFSRNIEGEFVMLNFLRFRAVADYSDYPEISPNKDISGREAYQLYIDHTLPFLHESGGDIIFLGKGGSYMIGPPDENWDLVMLIRQKSLEEFKAFASNSEYAAGFGHRQAGIEDSRLLPLEVIGGNSIVNGN